MNARDDKGSSLGSIFLGLQWIKYFDIDINNKEYNYFGIKNNNFVHIVNIMYNIITRIQL